MDPHIPTPEQISAIRGELLAWIVDQYGTPIDGSKQIIIDTLNPPPDAKILLEYFATVVVLRLQKEQEDATE